MLIHKLLVLQMDYLSLLIILVGENLNSLYSQSKLYYFRQIHEYLCVSSTHNLCTLFLMSFNDDFSLKNKTTFLAQNYYNSQSFSVYFNGILYTVANDNI